MKEITQKSNIKNPLQGCTILKYFVIVNQEYIHRGFYCNHVHCGVEGVISILSYRNQFQSHDAKLQSTHQLSEGNSKYGYI